MQRLNDYFDIKWLVLTVLFTAMVVVLTHIPKELMPSQIQAIDLDKFLHAVAYGAITFLFVLSLKVSFSLLWALFFLFVLLTVGGVDEITQPIVNREASYADLAANSIGIITVLSLSIWRKQELQRLKTESVSRLCFAIAVAFIAGVLVYPVTLILLNTFIGPNLQKEQKAAYSFFYGTMNELFQGNHKPEEGTVSKEALKTFNEHRHRLGDKCWLFIYSDWYSLERQKKGHFFGPAFFPSGDMFEVEMKRSDQGFVLKRLTPGDWESAWMEMKLLQNSKRE